MANYRVIDKQNWPRKDHFDFYRGFANPSFNLCVPVEAQRLYECAKDRGVSFFQLALYALVRAANGVPQLKQRLLGDDIIEYDQLAVMTPVMTAQEGFRQVWCDNAADFAAFSHAATPNIEAAKHTAPAPLIVNGENFFCASCLPWLHFSAITHAEYYVGAAVPALTWGKLKNGIIPVAGKFNHAFVDGLHASRFFARVEEGVRRAGDPLAGRINIVPVIPLPRPFPGWLPLPALLQIQHAGCLRLQLQQPARFPQNLSH
ncbi:Chloramphenicol acetyltransferase [Klebsiella michiganensis]|uniref:Chloramphenicol acetyltransferase n=1 Tax=Klebsiella michiganensis TaxID=1134687 RepID=A0A7H4MXR6_9ENTR|nr:Chloramphenicol acetyltransferase [Klebsiella michiganensis]